MGEASTLLLNLRVMYKLLGVQEVLYSALFALLFFVTRVLVFGLLLVQLFSHVSVTRASTPAMRAARSRARTPMPCVSVSGS